MGLGEPGPKDGNPRSAFALAKEFWNSGSALIATAAFLFSCTSLAVKLLGDEIPTFQVVLVPGIICFMATSLAVKLNGISVRSVSWRIAGLTLLRGVLGATSITCFYLAIEMLPLQDAVTLFFCSPVVASLLELAVTGESQGWACAAATACSVVGVVLVAQPACVFNHQQHPHHYQPHHSQDRGPPTPEIGGPGQIEMQIQQVHGLALLRGSETITAGGAALATVAAISNAAAFVVVRQIRESQGTLVLTWWYHGVVVAVSAVPLALGYPSAAVLPSRRGSGLLLVVGVTQLVGQLLLNRGFQLESATRGSAINVLQVLFSIVWDMVVLGDRPGVVSVAGSSLVVTGVLFMALTVAPAAASRSRPHRHPHADSDTDTTDTDEERQGKGPGHEEGPGQEEDGHPPLERDVEGQMRGGGCVDPDGREGLAPTAAAAAADVFADSRGGGRTWADVRLGGERGWFNPRSGGDGAGAGGDGDGGGWVGCSFGRRTDSGDSGWAGGGGGGDCSGYRQSEGGEEGQQLLKQPLLGGQLQERVSLQTTA